MTITATEAAAALRTTVRTVRAWCRTGRLAAVKSHGRWVIAPSAVARVICPATDRPRRGQYLRQLTVRAADRRQDRAAARAIAAEYGTRVIGHHTRARIAAANAGHILARDYLVGIGCDPGFVGKYESAFGRKVAATYRQRHGAEPDLHGGRVILRGRVWHVARYADITDLHRGARAYARTADMFGLVA